MHVLPCHEKPAYACSANTWDNRIKKGSIFVQTVTVSLSLSLSLSLTLSLTLSLSLSPLSRMNCQNDRVLSFPLFFEPVQIVLFYLVFWSPLTESGQIRLGPALSRWAHLKFQIHNKSKFLHLKSLKFSLKILKSRNKVWTYLYQTHVVHIEWFLQW